MAASCVCFGRGVARGPWSCIRPCSSCTGLYGDGVPGDGGWFALSDFAAVGEGLDGGGFVRGPWSVVQALDEHLEGSEHALGDVVKAFAVFAPEL